MNHHTQARRQRRGRMAHTFLTAFIAGLALGGGIAIAVTADVSGAPGDIAVHVVDDLGR